MSYIEQFFAQGAVHSQSTLSPPASVLAGERMPCASISHTGITVNANGQLVLSSGYTYILQASHYIEKTSGFGEMVSCWYDVTNGTYLGREVKSWVHTSPSAYKRTPIARCLIQPSVQTTVEMRIVSVTAGIIVNTNSLATYAGTPWYSVLSF